MSDAWTDPLLPPAQTQLEAALGRSMPPEGLTPEVIATLWNPATCPAPLLPWLAWALSVDEWDAEWSEEVQRAVCAASFTIHRRKGTVGAVRRVLQAINADVTLVEGWQEQPRGAPHSFRVDVEIEDRGLTMATLASIERQIAAVKPERSHFTTRLIGRTRATIYMGAAVVSGEVTEILPYRLTEAEGPPAKLYLGLGWWDYTITTVYPQGAQQ